MALQMVLILGGSLAVFLLVIGVIVSATEERSLVEERLGQYLQNEADRKAIEAERKNAPLTDWLNTRTERSTWGSGLSKQLARADLKLKVGEYIAVILIAASGVAMIFWMISGRSVIAAVMGAAVGFFIPRIYLNMQQGKRMIRFNDELSDMLNLMVNGLRAGYSTMQAMEAVSKELPPPICEEFRRVVQEMQLGVAMERALDNLLVRIPSPDLDLVVTAINVQREVGGNLAEILDTISHTIRERVRIKRGNSSAYFPGYVLRSIPGGNAPVLVRWIICHEPDIFYDLLRPGNPYHRNHCSEYCSGLDHCRLFRHDPYCQYRSISCGFKEKYYGLVMDYHWRCHGWRSDPGDHWPADAAIVRSA